MRDDLCIMRKVVDKFVLFVDSFYCTQVRFCFSAVGDFVFYGRPTEWADHYIFALWFLSFFFLRLISAVADWMSTVSLLLHMVWP